MAENAYIDKNQWIYEKKPRGKIFSTGKGWDSFAEKDWQFVTEKNKCLIGEMIATLLGQEQKVLDLAAGSWQYVPIDTAVDNSREMLLRNPASRRLLFNLDKLTEGYPLPIEDKFDAVLFCFGYNYVKDQNAVFREAKRILQPEGKIFVVGGISGGCSEFALRKFNADKIKVELENIGLDVIIHNVVDASGLPNEFKIVEAAKHIPDKQKLIDENIKRVKVALGCFEKQLHREYATIKEARKTLDTKLATQEEIYLRTELEEIRQVGKQLEKQFGVQIFIIPNPPLKKEFKLEDLKFSSVGFVLVDEGLANNNEKFSQIQCEAKKLLQDHIHINVNGSYIAESAEKTAEYLNREFRRTGKIRHIFFLSPYAFLYPSLYGDIQSFRKEVFKQSDVPERIIQRDLQRAWRNDELAIKNIYIRLQAIRRLTKKIETNGYL